MLLPDRSLKHVDQLGASLSLVCALHCALQPVLLVALPLVGLGFLMNELLETLFLGFSLTLAAWSFFSGYAHHRRSAVFGFWGVAASLIALSRMPWLESHEMILAVSGALSLVLGHLLNQYLHRQAHAVVYSEIPSESALTGPLVAADPRVCKH
ncbi:MAG: MerC domain-containing protein [Candidatus Sericytochromatia bacterium]